MLPGASVGRYESDLTGRSHPANALNADFMNEENRIYLTFNHIFFSYGNGDASLLNNLSFDLSTGDRMVIKGESGTGKTTIFRLLLGFEQPQKGEIQFKGQAMDSSTAKRLRKETAWLPQDLDLGSDTVISLVNLPFQFEQNNASQPSRDQIVETFERLGLPASALDNKFADLSTGQRQRVGIAICHLLDKPLILLDEPTSALDTASKEKVVDLLFEDAGRTILSTSHDPWWIEKNNTVFELDT